MCVSFEHIYALSCVKRRQRDVVLSDEIYLKLNILSIYYA